MAQTSNYDDRLQLLVELDSLTLKINRSVLDGPAVGYLENFIAHTLGTIPPANKTLFYGIQNNVNIATTSALRVLLENWANINYVVSNEDKKNSYVEKIEKSALAYVYALKDLLKQPSLGMTRLNKVPKWADIGPTARVKYLGDGPEFQYEFLCRYVHSDVWSVVNDHLVDQEYFKKVMLGWGLEFICETLELVAKEKAAQPFESKVSDASRRMRLLVYEGA